MPACDSSGSSEAKGVGPANANGHQPEIRERRQIAQRFQGMGHGDQSTATQAFEHIRPAASIADELDRVVLGPSASRPVYIHVLRSCR